MAYIPLDSETKVKGKAISLQGSNRAYLEDFEKTFWAAPTSTAAIRGVRPSMARLGSSAVPLRTSRKKPTPVPARTTGVMRAATPHPYFEDEAGSEHHDEGDGPRGRGEVAHEGGVIVGVRELRLELRLPGHLDEVDADPVGHNEGRQVAHVALAEEELEGVPDAHLGLLLLLGGLQLDVLGHHELVDRPVDGADAEAEDHDQGHHPAQGHPPAVDAGGQVGADGGEVLDRLARRDQGDVGAQAEERVELLGLVDGADLVGEAPEEHRDDDGAPELGHDVEEAVGPVPQDGDRG